MELVVVADKAEIPGIRRNTNGISATTQILSVPRSISAHTSNNNVEHFMDMQMYQNIVGMYSIDHKNEGILN